MTGHNAWIKAAAADIETLASDLVISGDFISAQSAEQIIWLRLQQAEAMNNPGASACLVTEPAALFTVENISENLKPTPRKKRD